MERHRMGPYAQLMCNLKPSRGLGPQLIFYAYIPGKHKFRHYVLSNEEMKFVLNYKHKIEREKSGLHYDHGINYFT